MSGKNVQRETSCPFTSQSVEAAYGPEVALFLHCHLRGYDRDGEGKYPDHEYYDKYGAPTAKDNSWEDGYHVIEKKLAEHYNAVVDGGLEFPLIAGMAGGVHLYKPLHDEQEKPWNWTGWIPRQKRWFNQGVFFSNRHFLGIRGNEIQNNLWDYDPFDEEPDADPTDLEYSQLEPNDRYRGGYWFYGQPFGRYLHIISLKSNENNPESGACKRYNYIVHPLAYRAAIRTIPDNSVDAMQWTIINIHEEPHFGEGKPWGDKCHGIEIFNDFTYYYSYQPIEDGGPHNGELAEDQQRTAGKDSMYYYWYDTYPLEYAIFLLDSALARGIYLQTMAANDAFYQRHGGDEEDSEQAKTAKDVRNADPKGGLYKLNMKHSKEFEDPRKGAKKAPSSAHKKKKEGESMTEVAKYLDALPYKRFTSFGYASLIDPRRAIKETVFCQQLGIPHMGLDAGEGLALDYLIKGRHFATTGLWDLFQYSYTSLPFRIQGQPDEENLCYEITENMEMVFTFLPTPKKNEGLLWRYTIMGETREGNLETEHGYFRLSAQSTTKLDLRSYEKMRMKWLYFSAMKPKNPMNRAWMHAIRGPAFGEPHLHAKLPPLKHNVVPTHRNRNTVTPLKAITPTASPSGDLNFIFGKGKNEHDIVVYFMQVYPHQQDLKTEPVDPKIAESSDIIPPRIRQSVHGFFNLRNDYPTRLNLTASWDKDGVLDNKIYFYVIPAETGQPKPMSYFSWFS